jgi:hypothetical protein
MSAFDDDFEAWLLQDPFGFLALDNINQFAYRRVTPRVVACRRCGKAGLNWVLSTEQKWVLHEANGLRHQCDETRVQEHVAKDFEELD